MQKRERGERSDKKTRISPGFDRYEHELIVRLSYSLGISKTEVVHRLARRALLDADIIEELQEKYRVPESRRAIPIIVQGHLTLSEPAWAGRRGR